jgi:hypothetical protein
VDETKMTFLSKVFVTIKFIITEVYSLIFK